MKGNWFVFVHTKNAMKVIILLVALFILTDVAGQSPERVTNFNIDSEGLALEGYDPISYFHEKKAVKGNKAFTAQVNGIRYYFSSESNKTMFLKSPSSFQPAYGGWCAYAMGAKGEKVEVDPETFKIEDGKLYLFYNRFFTNTLNSWNEKPKELKAKADKNWLTIVKK